METFVEFVHAFARNFLPNSPSLECLLYHRTDWSDIVAMKGAREVLKGVKYPDDATRRSLYASWLKVFASNEWHDTFDGLMLDCVAATPSPTTPETPLFADIYKDEDPIIDKPYPNVLTPVLNPDQMAALFAGERKPIEPLPASPGIIGYLADLIRKGRTSRAALDEAGLIISFYSLVLAVLAAKPAAEVQSFFRNRMKRALAAAVPTSYDGDVFCPSGMFLIELFRKIYSSPGLVKPFLVVLVVGQYAYHVNAKAAPRADVRFLEEGFLNTAMFGNLEVVELLYGVEKKTGLSAFSINKILMDDSSSGDAVAESCRFVAEFLEGTEQLMQKTRPWCRTANTCFFLTLNLCNNLDYAVRLTAVLAPDPNHLLWHSPEFGEVSVSNRKAARFWARDFMHNLRIGKYKQCGKAATSKTCEAK